MPSFTPICRLPYNTPGAGVVATVCPRNDSPFNFSFIILGRSSQSEDFTVQFFRVWMGGNAKDPGEKGAVLGLLGLAGGWEAVPMCPQGYNGHTHCACGPGDPLSPEVRLYPLEQSFGLGT